MVSVNPYTIDEVTPIAREVSNKNIVLDHKPIFYYMVSGNLKE